MPYVHVAESKGRKHTHDRPRSQRGLIPASKETTFWSDRQQATLLVWQKGWRVRLRVRRDQALEDFSTETNLEL